jgi:hypothetical protein
VWAQNRTTILCTPASSPAYARVFNPYACLRSGDIVTASPGAFLPCALCSAIHDPAQPAGRLRFDSRCLADLIRIIINIIIDRVV